MPPWKGYRPRDISMVELRESCPLVTISVSDSNELIGKNSAGEIVLRVPGRKGERGLKVQPAEFQANYAKAVKLGLIKAPQPKGE